MSDKLSERRDRVARRAKALRENLHRRKAQVRGRRAAQPADSATSQPGREAEEPEAESST